MVEDRKFKLRQCPFVKWRSYFFITDMKGDAVDLKKCPGTTDYEVRFSDRKLLITVFGMDQLRLCSRAIQIE